MASGVLIVIGRIEDLTDIWDYELAPAHLAEDLRRALDESGLNSSDSRSGVQELAGPSSDRGRAIVGGCRAIAC